MASYYATTLHVSRSRSRLNNEFIDKPAFAAAIQQQLAKLGNTRSGGRTHTFVSCPFHGENTPSCKVTHDASSKYLGSWHCFGCGESGKWATLAERLRLDPLNGKEFQQDRVTPSDNGYYELIMLGREDKAETAEEVEEEELHAGLHDLTDELAKQVGIYPKWRGYKLDFLRKLDAQLLRSQYGSWLLFLPVMVNGVQRGYIRARPKTVEGKTSYLNKKGSWSKNYGLFPFDYALALMKRKGLKTIVLVEGPRDALRLLRAGIPALCVLGTMSWSKSKVRLLEYAGVERIILCFDGDLPHKVTKRIPGKEATNLILPTIEGAFDTHVIKLWVLAAKQDRKIDPGNMPRHIIDSIKELL